MKQLLSDFVRQASQGSDTQEEGNRGDETLILGEPHVPGRSSAKRENYLSEGGRAGSLGRPGPRGHDKSTAQIGNPRDLWSIWLNTNENLYVSQLPTAREEPSERIRRDNS